MQSGGESSSQRNSHQGGSSNAEGRRLASKDLPSVRRLGKGLSGYLYETKWEDEKYVRKDFPLGSVHHNVFEKEAKALPGLDHPNIVRCPLYTVGKSSCSLLLEYVHDDLQNIIRKKIEVQGNGNRTGSSIIQKTIQVQGKGNRTGSSTTLHSRVLDTDETRSFISSMAKRLEITGADVGRMKMPENEPTAPFEVPEAVDIISEIATGIKFLHDNGIVHGDLKPQNVLVGNDGIVKLVDFGLVKTKKRVKLVSKRTRHFEILMWKAPELFEKLLGPVNEYSDDPFTDSDTDEDEEIESSEIFTESRLAMADVYSFGLVCSQILGGKLMYSNLSLTQLRERIEHGLRPQLPSTCPEDLRTLIFSMMELDPSCRRTFTDICTALKAFQRNKRPRLMEGADFMEIDGSSFSEPSEDHGAVEMVLEPISQVRQALETIKHVCTMSNAVRVNKYECKRIADRYSAIGEALKGRVKDTSFNVGNASDGSKRMDYPGFDGLLTVLRKGVVLVSSYIDSKGIINVDSRTENQESFKDIHEELDTLKAEFDFERFSELGQVKDFKSSSESQCTNALAEDPAIDPSSCEAISDDPKSKYKIFLSHSGNEKEFVDYLCKALEDCGHYSFFDRCPEGLPKGKEFPDLFKIIQQCQLFVVVISEEYFMSKWPMIELNAFVKAMKKGKSTRNPVLLPLYYRLSMSELKDEKRRQRWFENWETFATDDFKGLIKVDDWKYALHVLTKFNGFEYIQESMEVWEYEKRIVSLICELVTPNFKWDNSHVQGNAHEVIIEKIKQTGLSRKYEVKVVGLYGVGGSGKTTVCKTLCNELSNDFEGRVCHIEFESGAPYSKELFQKVLLNLTRRRPEFIQQLDEGECRDLLLRDLFKQKTFLAIDNVSEMYGSLRQAKVFLEASFHEDSLVIVTARAQSTLQLLGVDAAACLEMPKLSQGAATELFLYYASNGQKFSNEHMSSIDLCVTRCCFSNGDGSFVYHPLALEILGRKLGCQGKNPSEWVHALSLKGQFDAFSWGNPVFGVLRNGFDLLKPFDQALFMNVGFILHYLNTHELFVQDRILWSERLRALYEEDEEWMQAQLNSLERKGLLRDVDLSLERISMHDLYREFLVLEAKGNIGEAQSMWNRRWVYVDVHDGDLRELKRSPIGRCWPNLTLLSVRQDDDRSIAHPIESLAGIEWEYFSNVTVLQLYGLSTVKGTLSLAGMKCLRSLSIHNLLCVEGLEGLEGLQNLTLFEWSSDSVLGSSKPKGFVGQFPRSLMFLHMHVDCVLTGLDVLAQCNNLCKLALEYVEVGVQLDLSNCWSLEHVLLSFIHSLQTLLVPSSRMARMASGLQFLEVVSCPQLGDVRGLDQPDCPKNLDPDLEV